MKNLARITIGLLTVSSIVACGVKDRAETAAKMGKKNDKAKTQEVQQDAQAKACSSQPGDIYLGGILLSTNQDNGLVLANKIHTLIQTGKSGSAAQAVADLKDVKYSKLSDVTEETKNKMSGLKDAKTFLNFGCDVASDLPTDIASGWEDMSKKMGAGSAMTDLSVNSIFVCEPNQAMKLKMVSLYAEQIVFKKDASLKLESDSPGALIVYANKIKLDGNNAISARTLIKQSGNSGSNSPVHLNVAVFESLEGDSTLTMTTSSADCGATKADSTTPENTAQKPKADLLQEQPQEQPQTNAEGNKVAIPVAEPVDEGAE